MFIFQSIGVLNLGVGVLFYEKTEILYPLSGKNIFYPSGYLQKLAQQEQEFEAKVTHLILRLWRKSSQLQLINKHRKKQTEKWIKNLKEKLCGKGYDIFLKRMD